MTTQDIAAKLVEALLSTCSGIQRDYDLKEIQKKFDWVLRNTTLEMKSEKLPF